MTPPRTDPVEGAHRGARLGLPASGRASLAPFGPRFGALVVDLIGSVLVAALFVQVLRPHGPDDRGIADRLPGYWSMVPFVLDYVLGVLFAGRTLGMYLLGLRVIRVDRDAPVNPWRVALRTLLLLLLVPAVIFDRDGRGLHDRYTDTAVVRG